MGKLDGKVALVTGGNSGIGLATAKRFAAEGARVFVTARREAELDAAVAAIGGSAVGIRSDISKLDDLDRLFHRIREAAGKLDILFANAGGGEFVPLPAISEEHYERTFATNVKGTLFTVQKALPLMPSGASIYSLARRPRVPARQPLASTRRARPQSAASLATGSSILREQASG